jgi:predicted MFS family arabinose efflux permease
VRSDAHAARRRRREPARDDTMHDPFRPYPALVAALMLGVMTVGATVFAFSALLPDIAAGFGVPVARAAIVPAVFGLSLALVAPGVGLAVRRLPRANVIAVGLVVYAAAWVAAVSIRRFEVLLALAAVAGGATGAVLPATYAYAADLAPADQRARVMGRIVTGWSLSILLMVPLMSAVTQFAGWRVAFGLLAACALLVAGALRIVPRPPPAPLDADGADGVAASLRRVLTDRPTMLVLAANLLDMGAFYGVLAFAAAEMRRVGGLGASLAGLALAAYGAGLAITSVNAHRIDRWGRKRAGVGALVLLACWLPVLPWLARWPWAMAAGILAWGVVQGAFFTSITTLATDQIPDLRGVVTALLGGSTYLGVSLYTPVSAALYAGPGYWAVGLASAAGCAVAAVLLARLPAARG